MDCERLSVEIGGNRRRSYEPTMHRAEPEDAFLNLYLEQPIAKGLRQPIGGHVSYLIDSPTRTV